VFDALIATVRICLDAVGYSREQANGGTLPSGPPRASRVRTPPRRAGRPARGLSGPGIQRAPASPVHRQRCGPPAGGAVARRSLAMSHRPGGSRGPAQAARTPVRGPTSTAVGRRPGGPGYRSSLAFIAGIQGAWSHDRVCHAGRDEPSAAGPAARGPGCGRAPPQGLGDRRWSPGRFARGGCRDRASPGVSGPPGKPGGKAASSPRQRPARKLAKRPRKA